MPPEELSDLEALDVLQAGYQMLLTWSRNIAMLPLEEWQSQLDRAETLGPILDPTLYRKYLYSDKPDILKSILSAAIPLKHAVLSAQPKIADVLRREASERERSQSQPVETPEQIAKNKRENES